MGSQLDNAKLSPRQRLPLNKARKGWLEGRLRMSDDPCLLPSSRPGCPDPSARHERWVGNEHLWVLPFPPESRLIGTGHPNNHKSGRSISKMSIPGLAKLNQATDLDTKKSSAPFFQPADRARRPRTVFAAARRRTVRAPIAKAIWMKAGIRPEGTKKTSSLDSVLANSQSLK